MNLVDADSRVSLNPHDLDGTHHLRDHLECALHLARRQHLSVVHYLIEMAILAMSYRSTEADENPDQKCDA